MMGHVSKIRAWILHLAAKIRQKSCFHGQMVDRYANLLPSILSPGWQLQRISIFAHLGEHVGPRLQSPGFMILMITKHMWLFVLIKFKCLSLSQVSKDSKSFFSLKKGVRDSRRFKYGIRTQNTQRRQWRGPVEDLVVTQSLVRYQFVKVQNIVVMLKKLHKKIHDFENYKF